MGRLSHVPSCPLWFLCRCTGVVGGGACLNGAQGGVKSTTHHPSIFIWATETRDANIWVGGLASVETSQHFIPIIIFWMQLANGPPPPPAAAASRPVIFSDQFANGVPVVEAQLERREAAAELTCSHRQATISPHQRARLYLCSRKVRFFFLSSTFKTSDSRLPPACVSQRPSTSHHRRP